jgi:hypothetical protein
LKIALFFSLLISTVYCSAQKNGADWINLFDGSSLKGWTPNFDDQRVEVKDGMIQMLSVKKNLWLVHKDVFSNFELVAEIKAPLGDYNTGIAFRCDETPIGYQCEIFDQQSGSLYAIKKGWIFPPSKGELEQFYAIAKDSYKKGEWNSYRIKCEDDHIQIWVNGHKTTDIHDDTFKSGRVAIQHHGKGDMHFFRNIKIRPLP